MPAPTRLAPADRYEVLADSVTCIPVTKIETQYYNDGTNIQVPIDQSTTGIGIRDPNQLDSMKLAPNTHNLDDGTTN